MPEYTYERADGTTFIIRQSIKEDALEVCPETGQTVCRVIGLPTIIDKTPRTLGSYAEANTKRIGKTKIQEEQGAYEKPQQKMPWWRKGPINKKLVKANDEQKEKYIRTGKI